MRNINLFRHFPLHTSKPSSSAQRTKKIAETMDVFDARISETLGTLSHFTIFLIAFLLVAGIFWWKEGRWASLYQQSDRLPSPAGSPRNELDDVPSADVGIRMLMDQVNGEMSTDSASFATSQATLSPTTPTAQVTPAYPTLNLTGPWRCSAQNSVGTAQLFIADNALKFTYTISEGSTHALLAGDCLYNWQGAVGQKQCGLSAYIPLIEQWAGPEGFDVGDLLADQMVQDDPDQVELYMMLRASCVPEKPNTDNFLVPTNVTWDESSVEEDIWSTF